jgi:hypothetical protein
MGNPKLDAIWDKARDVTVSCKRLGKFHTETLVTVTAIFPVFSFIGPDLTQGSEEMAPVVVSASGYCERPSYEVAMAKAVDAIVAQCAERGIKF